MECPKCGNKLYVDFRSNGYTLWRCEFCPYMEVTEEHGENASPCNSWEKPWKEVRNGVD